MNNLTKGEKMFNRLALKCVDRMLNASDEKELAEDIKPFEILIELHKFFRSHPPEKLNVKYLF
jgi:hypothetical protein